MTTLYFWQTSSGRIDLAMTLAQAQAAYHQGQCDADVAALALVPDVAAQLAVIEPALLAEELREYGAWDDAERSNHTANLLRLVWLAAADIVERPQDYIG